MRVKTAARPSPKRYIQLVEHIDVNGIILHLCLGIPTHTPLPAEYILNTMVPHFLQLTFHEPHEVPLVTELSVGVQPGTQASIMLHKSEVSLTHQ